MPAPCTRRKYYRNNFTLQQDRFVVKHFRITYRRSFVLRLAWRRAEVLRLQLLSAQLVWTPRSENQRGRGIYLSQQGRHRGDHRVRVLRES